MKRITKIWRVGLLALVIASWLAMPRASLAGQAAPAGKAEPVLAGPKVEKETRSDKRFNGQRVRGSDFQHALDTLTLSDEQKQQIKTFTVQGRAARAKWQKDHHEEIIALRKQVEDARKAGDDQAVKDGQAKIKALYTAAPQNSQIVKNIRSVLTLQQTQQLGAKIKALRQQRLDKQKKSTAAHKKKGKGKIADKKTSEQPEKSDRQLDL